MTQNRYKPAAGSCAQPRAAALGCGHARARRPGHRGLTRAWARSSRRGLPRTGWSSPSTASTTTNELAAVVGAIQSDGGVAAAFDADVTDDAAVDALAAAVTDRLGPIDILVVNATGPQPNIPLLEVGWDDHLAQLDYFVRSPVLLGRHIVPGMQARGYGRIVHIDSEVADRPPPHRSAYTTAKSARRSA